MPKYFFHICHGEDERDEDGVELRSVQEAWTEAMRTTGAMLRDLSGSFRTDRPWTMTVTDARNEEICVLRFSADIVRDWRL